MTVYSPTHLTAREAAEMIGCGLSKLCMLARNGDVKAKKVGGKRIYFRSDILVYLMEHDPDRLKAIYGTIERKREP